jgi:hypothetical protein
VAVIQNPTVEMNFAPDQTHTRWHSGKTPDGTDLRGK